MKALSFMMYVVVAILCLAFAGSASAGGIRLHVERIMTVSNGTSNGLSLASHTFTKYYDSTSACTTQANAYNAETKLSVDGRNIAVLTKAVCEDWNPTNLQ